MSLPGMRILVIVPVYGRTLPTGAFVTTREYVQGLIAAGHAVDVVTRPAGPANRGARTGRESGRFDTGGVPSGRHGRSCWSATTETARPPGSCPRRQESRIC